MSLSLYMYTYISRIACGKVPHVALVRWNSRVEFCRRGCLRLFCRCFTYSGPEKEDSDAKMEAKRYQQFQKGTKRMPKLANGRPKTHPGEHERSRCEKVAKRWAPPGTKWEPFLIQINKNITPKSSKQLLQKTLNSMTKWCQNDQHRWPN